jgi:hypothetical protein
MALTRLSGATHALRSNYSALLTFTTYILRTLISLSQYHYHDSNVDLYLIPTNKYFQNNKHF